MREAFGGSMLLYILIPVMFIFIFFIAFIMNYASAYRASNYIVTQIETCDADLANCAHSSFNAAKSYVKSRYHYNGDIDFCSKPNAKGTLYRVTLYVSFDVPLIGDNLIKYPVRSETKTLYNVTSATGISNVSECN